jgi:cytochrome c
MRGLIILAAMGLGLGAVSAPAYATGDASEGQELFHAKCNICHSPEAGTNKVGPSLHGVLGRKAGALPDYSYSDAMKSSGKTWDEASLDSYLANPRGTIPGVKMMFPGLPEAGDRANVIAYLGTLK